MKEFLSRLTSRKFILAALTTIAGILTLIFGKNETIEIVMGGLATVLPPLVYCLVEGAVDKERAKTIVTGIQDTAKELGSTEAVDTILEGVEDMAESILDDESEAFGDE